MQEPDHAIIGIPAACLDKVFPFHIAVGENLSVLQIGQSMRRIAPALEIGTPLGEHFRLRRPHGELTLDLLRLASDQPFLLQLRHSGIRLRGQFLALPDGRWLFLGSPWFDSAAEIEQAGLSLFDYPAHDPMTELLMIGQTQQMAVRDLREVNERLEQQREAVRLTEQVYREAIAAANAVAFQENATGDRYEFIDAGIEKVTGVSHTQITPARLASLIVESTSEDSSHVATEDLSTPKRREHRLVGADNEDIWLSEAAVHIVDDSGNINGRVGILEDITDRKHKESELERIGAQLDTILKHSPQGIAAFDAQGRLSYCNPSFEDMTGTTREQVEGLELGMLDAIFHKLCSGKQPLIPLSELGEDDTDEIMLTHPQQRALTRSLRRMESAAGDLRGWVLSMRDVTREREIDRMKSEFLATAAHELRTPMTSVGGFAELLLLNEYDAEVTREIAETIHRQSELLVHIVNELLDIARIEAGGLADFVIERHCIAELLEQTVSSLNIPGESREVKIGWTDGRSPVVLADAKKTIQALTNVLSNAFKYSPEGGEITVNVMRQSRAGRSFVSIEVVDQGIGMESHEVARLFERFYRADPSGKIPGTGLGMSLVKDIIELQDGVVEIDSVKGKGTTVSILLPAAEDCADGRSALNN